MQAEPVARYLGIDHVVCNRFVVDEHGIVTGAIEQPVIWGNTKATSVQMFAAEHGIDLRSSYFYADGDEDLALMYLVGNPRPVNPGPEADPGGRTPRLADPAAAAAAAAAGRSAGPANLAALGSLWPGGRRRAGHRRAEPAAGAPGSTS